MITLNDAMLLAGIIGGGFFVLIIEYNHFL
jgi:hypothetical protein